jgi:hypothetical protein
MRGRLLTCGLVLLTLAAPGSAEESLILRVTPIVARAPTDVEIQATVEPNPDNRSLRFVAESDSYYRSSQVDLTDAPATCVVRYRGLPKGNYTVTVTLTTADGRRKSAIKRFSVV